MALLILFALQIAVTGFQINFRRIDATVDVASMENVATSAGIGLTVLGLSYSFASLSGAHVNPSITFAGMHLPAFVCALRAFIHALAD